MIDHHTNAQEKKKKLDQIIRNDCRRNFVFLNLRWHRLKDFLKIKNSATVISNNKIKPIFLIFIRVLVSRLLPKVEILFILYNVAENCADFLFRWAIK